MTLCPHLPDPQTWDSHLPHHLPLGPATTATSSLVSPAIRARAQHWTSKGLWRAREGTDAGREPVGRVKWVDSSPLVPAPLSHEALALASFLYWPRVSPSPQHAGMPGKEKREVTSQGWDSQEWCPCGASIPEGTLKCPPLSASAVFTVLGSHFLSFNYCPT